MKWWRGKDKINEKKFEKYRHLFIIHWIRPLDCLNKCFFGESTGVVTSPLLSKGWRTWRTLHRTLEQRKVQPYRHIISFELTWWDLVCHIVNFVFTPIQYMAEILPILRKTLFNQSINQFINYSLNQLINQSINPSNKFKNSQYGNPSLVVRLDFGFCGLIRRNALFSRSCRQTPLFTPSSLGASLIQTQSSSVANWVWVGQNEPKKPNNWTFQ